MLTYRSSKNSNQLKKVGGNKKGFQKEAFFIIIHFLREKVN
jgi:hypothetical protein